MRQVVRLGPVERQPAQHRQSGTRIPVDACLEDGSEVWGILYPRALAEGRAPDITAYGGWREYVAARERL